MNSLAPEASRRRRQAEARPQVRERVGLLVVGMHRSGTSASTRILSLLGAELPGNLMPSNAEFNASGYWESLDVVALNEDLLAAAHSSWEDVLPLDAAQLPAEDLKRFHEGARALLERDFGGSDWFVLKDPRIGRLLRPWLQAVRSLGARPLVVLPVRHPLEVAESLRRREGFDAAKSLYLWLRHMVDVLRSSRDVPRGIMVYDELMADWRASVDRLARELGISWPREPEQVAAQAEQFLDPGLRHHQVRDAGGHHGLVARRAFELYEALCRRAAGLDELADAIHAELAPMEELFAPLQRDVQRRQRLMHEERARLKEAEAERDDLLAQRERAVAQIAEQQATIQADRAAHARLESEFDEKTRHVQALGRELDDLRSQRDQGLARIRELEEEIGSARAAHAQTEAAFEDKSRHVQVLAREVQDLQEQRARATEHIAALEEKARHVQLLTAEVRQEQAQRSAALAKVQELQDTIASERRAHAELLRAFEDKARHVEILQHEVGDLLGQRGRALERIAALESAHAQALSAHEQAQQAHEQAQQAHEQAQQAHEQAQRTIRDYAARLAAVEEEAREWRGRHAQAEARSGELEQDLQRAREEQARQEAEIAARLEQLRQALDARHGGRRRH